MTRKEPVVKTLASRRVRVLAAVTVIAAAGLTGCSAHPGKAAVVTFTDPDGVRHTASISQGELTPACEDLKAVADCSSVLRAMLDSELMTYLAQRYKVTASAKEEAQVLQGYGVDPATAAAGTRRVARSQVLQGKLSQLPEDKAAAVQKDSQLITQDASVDASPRFQWPGSWMIQQDNALGADASTGADQGQPQEGADQGQPQEGADQGN